MITEKVKIRKNPQPDTVISQYLLQVHFEILIFPYDASGGSCTISVVSPSPAGSNRVGQLPPLCHLYLCRHFPVGKAPPVLLFIAARALPDPNAKKNTFPGKTNAVLPFVLFWSSFLFYFTSLITRITLVRDVFTCGL